MKKEFSIKKNLFSLIVLVAIMLALDFFTPGFDLLVFKFGRAATASLVIDYGKEGIRQFTGEVVQKMTIFDALMASSRAGLKVDYTSNGSGLTFLSIDGRSGPVKIKVNGRLILVEELNKISLTSGDLVEIELP